VDLTFGENKMDTTSPKSSFLEPWEPVLDEWKEQIQGELKKEMQKMHVLYGFEAEPIGKRIDCDDTLFKIKKEEKEALAVVHLTWSGKPDQFPSYPSTEIYDSWEEFEKKDMIPTHEDYIS